MPTCCTPYHPLKDLRQNVLLEAARDGRLDLKSFQTDAFLDVPLRGSKDGFSDIPLSQPSKPKPARWPSPFLHLCLWWPEWSSPNFRNVQRSRSLPRLPWYQQTLLYPRCCNESPNAFVWRLLMLESSKHRTESSQGKGKKAKPVTLQGGGMLSLFLNTSQECIFFMDGLPFLRRVLLSWHHGACFTHLSRS